MIEPEAVHNNALGFAIILVLITLVAFGMWVYKSFIWKPEPSVNEMPHRYDGLTPLQALHDMEERIMMLEDGIMGLIKRCDSIELGDERESISKRLDHLGKWISKIEDKVQRNEEM